MIKVTDLKREELERLMEEHDQLNPDHPVSDVVKESLLLYVNRRIPPGGFLLSVLENDLFGALGRADSYNRASIFQICQYVMDTVPRKAYGNSDKVTEWLRR